MHVSGFHGKAGTSHGAVCSHLGQQGVGGAALAEQAVALQLRLQVCIAGAPEVPSLVGPRHKCGGLVVQPPHGSCMLTCQGCGSMLAVMWTGSNSWADSRDELAPSLHDWWGTWSDRGACPAFTPAGTQGKGKSNTPSQTQVVA